VQDVERGPAFVRVGTYLTYPVRVCLNGRHWRQQQFRRAGVAFETVDNGFRWCEQPARLQAVCDAVRPTDVQAFFDRWLDRLSWPLTSVDQAAGYWHRLSVWQVEVEPDPDLPPARLWTPTVGSHDSRNLYPGRPDRVSLVFPTRLTRAHRRPGMAIGRV
jgi:hypothetical protein